MRYGHGRTPVRAGWKELGVPFARPQVLQDAVKGDGVRCVNITDLFVDENVGDSRGLHLAHCQDGKEDRGFARDRTHGR